MKYEIIFNGRITSNINNVCALVSDALNHFKRQCQNIQEDVLFDLKVILNELVLNAIKHGNNEDESKYVRLTAGILKGQRVFVIVEDDGEGYDYSHIIKKNNDFFEPKDLCDIKETGRGILIVSNLCEQLRFNKKGNKIVIMKKF